MSIQRWVPQTEDQKNIDAKLREILAEEEIYRKKLLLNRIKNDIDLLNHEEFGLDWTYIWSIQEFLKIYVQCLDNSQDYYKLILKSDRSTDTNNKLIMRRIYRNVHDHFFLHEELQKCPRIVNWLPENWFQIELDNDFRNAFDLKGNAREKAFISLAVKAYTMTTLQNQLPDVIFFAWEIHALAKIEAGVLHSGTRSSDEVLDKVYANVNEILLMNASNDSNHFFIRSTKEYIKASISLLSTLMINKMDTEISIENIEMILNEVKNKKSYICILLNTHIIAQKQIFFEVSKLRDQGFDFYKKDDKSFKKLNFISRIGCLIELEIMMEYDYRYKQININRAKKRSERKNLIGNYIFSKIDTSTTIPEICNKIENTFRNTVPDMVDFTLKPQKSVRGNTRYQMLLNDNNDLRIGNVNALWAMYQRIIYMNQNNDNRVEPVIEIAEQFLKAAGPHLTNSVSFQQIYEDALYKTYDIQKFVKGTKVKPSFFGTSPEFLNLLVHVFSQIQYSDKNQKMKKNEISLMIEIEKYKASQPNRY